VAWYFLMELMGQLGIKQHLDKLDCRAPSHFKHQSAP
jgi:hypothetical protein